MLKGTVSPLNKCKLEIWLFLPILVHNTRFEQVQLSLNMEISKRFLYKLFILFVNIVVFKIKGKINVWKYFVPEFIIQFNVNKFCSCICNLIDVKFWFIVLNIYRLTYTLLVELLSRLYQHSAVVSSASPVVSTDVLCIPHPPSAYG